MAALFLVGCYASHGVVPPEVDGGTSRFEGRWLIDQPTHATYEVTIYDFRADGRVIEECSFSLGGPVPTGTVERAADGTRCTFVGPWSSLRPDTLAVETWCSDSVERTAVLDVAWGAGAPSSVTVRKVDGEETGWAHGPFDWRWLPCAAFPDECAGCDGPRP